MGGTGDTRDFYEKAYGTERWRRPDPDGRGSPGARFAKMWYHALLEHFVPRLNLPGKTLLEVGCGHGYLAGEFQALGAVYIGLDLAFNAVRQFTEADGQRLHAVVGDGGRLPVTTGSMDVVLCMEVLEHVPDPERVLDECFRVVRADGYLVFSRPSYLNLFLVPKVLADVGMPGFRRYMNRQATDRTTTGPGLRRLLARRGAIVAERAVRLHPPLFEQLDYRLPEGHALRRLNDWISTAERRWGDRAPLKWLGLHSLFLVKPRPA
jgi:2-polyprenyl-3-methyl-5-hydroxy-6-metoxy-1,4-benzoquinol methylase